MKRSKLDEGWKISDKIDTLEDQIESIQLSIGRVKIELEDGNNDAHIPLQPGIVGINFVITKEKLLIVLWQSNNELKIKLAFEERKLREL